MAIDSYLKFLESTVAAYVHLVTRFDIVNPDRASKQEIDIINSVRKNYLPAMRAHLASNLSGVASSNLREDMMKKIWKVVQSPIRMKADPSFPSVTITPDHCNTIGIPDGRVTELFYKMTKPEDRRASYASTCMTELARHGPKCGLICTSGTFIVEVMTSLVLNEDVTSISNKVLTRDVTFNAGITVYPEMYDDISPYAMLSYPTIVLSHYAMELEKARKEGRHPKLRQLDLNSQICFSALPDKITGVPEKEAVMFWGTHVALIQSSGTLIHYHC